MLPPLHVTGMHGLGDNLHQRAVLRQLMQRHEVWLDTSWVAPYYDLIAQGLNVCHRHTFLRTQHKNAAREMALFSRKPIPPGTPTRRISYRPTHPTVLAAMCEVAGVDYATADYRFPKELPGAWRVEADALFTTDKPICVYRPLSVRPEWKGNEKRNADANEYAELFAAIRDTFYVVSVADFEDRREWPVGQMLKDVKQFHSGELPFEVLAGLWQRADLVYTSGGFAAILAMAVETPVISVFGSYERAEAISSGSRYSPYLGIEPIAPCSCMNGDCRKRCSKHLDVDKERSRIISFVDGLGLGPVIQTTATADMFGPPTMPANAVHPLARFNERWQGQRA